MTNKILFFFGVMNMSLLTAQNLAPEMLFPDTLRSNSDSFYVSSPNFRQIVRQVISRHDALNLGTAGYQGIYMKIWTDIDSIIIPDVNYPYYQLIKIPVVSPHDTSMCILRFEDGISDYTEAY